MDNINLDLNTYTIKELETLLKLNQGYTEQEIILKKENLQKYILESAINENKKNELQIFLDNIKNKLITNLLNSLRPDDTIYNEVKRFDGNHFVIKNNNENYTSVLENNKTINKSIIKKTYTIDSLFRQNYDNPENKSQDFHIDLPETINNALTMTITSLEIPLAYHNISEELNNNTFHLIIDKVVDDGNGNLTKDQTFTDISKAIVLTTGLYEARYTSTGQICAADIEKEINQRFLELDIKMEDGVTPSDLSRNLSFKVNLKSGFSQFLYKDNQASASGKFSFQDNYRFKIDWNVNNTEVDRYCSRNELYQKLGWQLGFRQNEIYMDKSSVYTSTDGETKGIASASICHISYPRYLYISIDDYQQSSRNYFAVASDSMIAPNIIGRINILSLLEEKTAFRQAATAGDYLYTQKMIREYFGPTTISKLKVRLLDEFGRSFPINNADWSFVCTFECLYN